MEDRYLVQHYEDDPNSVWSWYTPKEHCDHCGANVYSHWYDTVEKKIYCKCSGCGRFIYEIKPEYTEENLKEGIWKCRQDD